MSFYLRGFTSSSMDAASPPTRFTGRNFLRLLLLILLALLGLELLTLLSDMAGNSALRLKDPDSSAFIRDYEWTNKTRVQLQWKPLGEISDHLKRAVLVSEDDMFLEHEGLNVEEFKKTWELNWKKKKIVRGGSTITMQLIKNLYFSPSKNPIRKLNEILLAFDLERKLTKDRILEIYLNIVEWGPGIYGAENAAQYYFHKGSGRLNPSEAAFLSAILPNPLYFTGKGSTRTKRRKASILHHMGGQALPEEEPISE